MGSAADLLDAAATRIEHQDQHPGQMVPNLWAVGGENAPAKLIGMVAAKALAEVCHERGAPFEDTLARYTHAAKHVALTPIGAPDTIAIAHLRDAAQELRRLAVK